MKLQLRPVACMIFLFLNMGTADAQNIFSKVYYDSLDFSNGYSMAPSIDNGYVIAGRKSQTAMIYKIDSAGTILWNNEYSMGSPAIFNRITPVGDSSFIAAGSACFFPNNWDLVCMKIDFSGDTVWTMKYGSSSDPETANSVEQTSDGGYILSGHAQLFASSTHRSLILKIDSSGALEWDKSIVTGTLSNYAFSIRQTPDSGYILTGITHNTSPIGMMLMKLNPSGAVSWARTFRDSPNNLQGVDVAVLPDGFACLVMNGNDYALMRTDTSGNIIWIKTYRGAGGSICYNCFLSRLRPSSDGGYSFISGGHLLLKTDSLGNLEWVKGIQVEPTDHAETKDNGYMVVGNRPAASWTVPRPHIGIIRTDSLGNSGMCSFSETISVSVDTFAVSNLTFTQGGFSNNSSVQPLISFDNLISDTGCAPIIGGLNEIRADDFISISPNPASSQINFFFAKGARQYALSLFNSLGQEVFSRTLTGDETIAFTLYHSLPSGIYVAKLTSGNNQHTKKIVIE